MSNPFDINREFEAALCEYTGAPYCVLTNSCTMALFLALKWHANQSRWCDATVTIPKRTYVSVPMVIKQAGFSLDFVDCEWSGAYRLAPFNIYDSARLFTSDMFESFDSDEGGGFVCVSFHSTKTLGIRRHRIHPAWDGQTWMTACGEKDWDIEQGGAILHNSPEADAWFRRARFDGRTEGVAPKDDHFDMLGWHAYMSPATARLGLKLLHELPEHNSPLPNDDYPDLSMHPIFGGKGAR